MSHGPWEGRGWRERDRVVHSPVCQSVAVTRGGHRGESRAQRHRPPRGTRGCRPRAPSPFPSTHFLPVLSFSHPGAFPAARTGDADSTATATHLVTPAPRHSHTHSPHS